MADASEQLKLSWNHPDLRLSKIIINAMSGEGVNLTSLSRMLDLNTNLLKEHYGKELEYAKKFLALNMREKIMKITDNEDPKVALKAAIYLHNYADNKDQQGRNQDSKESEAEEKAKGLPSFIDPSKYDVKEMRELLKLLEKGQTDNSRVVVDVKAKND